MIIHITGEHDTGKTLMALGLSPPIKTVYILDDVKHPPIVIKEFGQFIDLTQEAQELKLLQLQDYIIKVLSKIPKGMETIVFDTWSRIGLAFRQWAILHPYNYREKTTFSKLGAAKGGEMWAEAHRYEASQISNLAQLVENVILITHLKNEFKAGAHTGREIPDSGKALNKICNFRIWLRHNEGSGVPIALVLKRLAQAKVSSKGIEIVNVLPRRIKPLPEEKSVWEAINRYKAQPFGNRSPLPEETPTPFELSILDGILTDDQKEVWRAGLEELKGTGILTELEEVKLAVQDLSKEGQPLTQIHSYIQDNFNGSYDLSQISEMMK